MATVIAVVSGKGGVGKSTLCASLAAAMAKTGYNTLAVDLDFGLRNLDVMLGLEQKCTYDLGDIFLGNCDIAKATYTHPAYPKLSFIAAAAVVDRGSVSVSKMKEFISLIADKYDYVFLDCPAGLNNGFVLGACVADMALIVTTMDVFATKDVAAAAACLDKYSLTKKALIVNRVNPVCVSNNYLPDIDDIIDTVGVQLIGIVPEDENISVAVNSGKIIDFKKSTAGKCVYDIKGRIEGENIKQYRFW